MSRTRKDIALEYAAKHGFAVFPLAPKTKVPLKGSHGFKDATKEPAEIDKNFADPGFNIAIATGEVSGMLGVVDLDLAEDQSYDGRDELIEWEREHEKFPETATVTTGRGGMQLYYWFPNGVPDSYKNEYFHVDFRGEKGYAMAPGSVHPNGKEVFWDLDPDDYPIVEATESVIAFVEHFRPPEQDADGKPKRFEMPDVLLEGARDETIFKYACSERARNVPYDVVLAAALVYNREHSKPPLPEKIIEQKIDSAFKHEAGTSRGKKGDDGIETLSGRNVWSNPELEPKFNKEGEIVGYYSPTVPAIAWWLDEDPGLKGVRLECMSQQVTIDNGLPWNDGATLWQGVDDDYLYARVQQRYKDGGKALVRSDKNVFKAFSIFCHRHRYDVMVDMLNALPKWDGRSRAATVFIEFLGAEDTEYTREVTLLLLYAAIARALEPGCKYDHMVVLEGPQGIGKSRIFRLLAKRDEFFMDDIKNIGSKDAQELIQGRWFVEFGELSAFNNARIEALKQFVTSQKDTYRVPYAKRPIQLPRRCVLVGSTNSHEYLEDPTGNRRFLPVICKGADPAALFTNNIGDYFDQVWAEMMAAYKEKPGRALILPKSVAEEAARKQAEATTEDPWIGLIGRWLCNKPVGTVTCTMQLLCDAIGIDKKDIKKADTMRCSQILRTRFPDWRKTQSNRAIDGYGMQRAFEKVPPEPISVQQCLPGV